MLHVASVRFVLVITKPFEILWGLETLWRF